MISEWLIKNKAFWSAKILMHCDVHPSCLIGDNLKFGHGGRGVCIGNAVIGNNGTIMQGVQIINNFTTYGNEDWSFPTIEDNVIIGTHAIILGKITIGANSIIGAGAIVTKDVPPNSIVYSKKDLVIKEKGQ